jgi:acetyltransferase-like isoleucine patch superfamily enzyme
MDTDGHPLWPPESRWSYPGDEFDADVNIGKNVFVGLNVIILKGVSIGDNSMIAAGSVVNKSIPDNCLAAGIPAIVVKQFAHGSPAD